MHLWLAFLSATFASLSDAQDQRLPRQAAPTTAAIQGIVLSAGSSLGLGGAAVTLQNAATGSSATATSAGDGSFRFLNLAPGTYRIQAAIEGFEPFQRADIDLKPGDVFALEINLNAAPAPASGLRAIPRQPALGPAPEGGAPEAGPASPYRTLPGEPPPPTTGEPRPLAPLPGDAQVFEVVPERWSLPFPTEYHRYPNGEVPYVEGRWYDPFNRNKLKGDYPIIGNRTFFNLSLTSDTFFDGRRLPVPSGLGSASPGSADFYGRFRQIFTSENMAFSMTLYHGDTSFKPVDWQIRFTPVINLNYLDAQENGIVNFDVRKGNTRFDEHLGLQEGFVEVKLKDLSNSYDFVSARAGIQEFTSDFRGFIFSDQEPGLRLFGNFGSNRYQYNAAYFAMLEKDTNSGLNTMQYRSQQVMIANLYRQDFFVPGYTVEVSFHYNKDDPSFQYDTNNFLVRPAPIGIVRPHSLRAYYYGLAGDGHIGRLNVSNAFYQVLGHDNFNEIAGHKVDINAQMAALELSLDKDWLRYRVSFFYASGEKNPRGNTAHGFDAIFDDPNFAGGQFSFWDREGVRLLGSGVALENGGSLIPDLRTSKLEGQSNFVNPGVLLYNAGVDINVTPKLKGFVNLNLLRFVHTEPLELLLFQAPIHAGIGADSGIGASYRPPLSENMVITGGVNAFEPFQGFRDISTSRTLFSLFLNVRFRF